MINTITKHISLQRMAFVFALLFFLFSIFACDTTIQIGGSIFIGIILLTYSSGVNPSKIKAWILQSGFEVQTHETSATCIATNENDSLSKIASPTHAEEKEFDKEIKIASFADAVDTILCSMTEEDLEKNYQLIIKAGIEDQSELDKCKLLYLYRKLLNDWGGVQFDEIDHVVSTNSAVAHWGSYIKGCVFSRRKDYENSCVEFKKAIDLASTDKDKFSYIKNWVDDFLKFSEAKYIIDEFTKYLDAINDSKVKAKMYILQSTLYRKNNETILATACELKASTIVGYEEHSRFDLAYNADDTLAPLKALNYDIILKSGPNGAATNNLAIICNGNKMPRKGFTFLNKAIEKNESLSASNLANRYIEIGDLEKASEILEKALATNEVHENVYSSQLKIKETERKEEDTWNEFLNKGLEVKDFLLKFYEAYHTASTSDEFCGIWKIFYGMTLTISAEQKIKNDSLRNGWISKTIKGDAVWGNFHYQEKTILFDDFSGQYYGFFDHQKKVFKMMVLSDKIQFYDFNKIIEE